MIVIYLRDLNLCQSNKMNMFLLYKYVVDTNTGFKTTEKSAVDLLTLCESRFVVYCGLYTCMTAEIYSVWTKILERLIMSCFVTSM
jgi:hypothetical protein